MENNTHRKKDSARLFWDSKPKRAANPKDIEFQTAEVVIPNPEKAGQLPMSFRDNLVGEDELDKQKMNRLIWGDNLLAMQALLAQGYEGKINLIYIDPPFDSKADYSHKIKLLASAEATAGKGDLEITKEPSVIERLAYKDTWAGGTDSYLDMLYPRLQLMKRLLAPNGSIYVHLDWHVGHYVKVMMDEVFGKDNFVREIIWYRGNPSGGKAAAENWIHAHDNILYYSKTDQRFFNKQYEKYSDEYIKERFIHDDNDGKGSYRLQGSGDNLRKQYLSESKGRAFTSVWQIPDINVMASDRTEYDTQKPADLLELIIGSSSPNNGIVADFFAGSGTTLAVAEELNRRWIGCELGKVGIQVARGRLVEQESKPFLIENIGNYQREMIYLGGGRIYEMQKIILKLYGAEPMANRKDLGVRLPAFGAGKDLGVRLPAFGAGMETDLPAQGLPARSTQAGTQTGRLGYFVYAIRCDDESIYIGQTSDLLRRWEQHCEGTARWTAAHKPVEVIHHEEFNTQEEAEERERRLKTGFGRKWIKRELKAGRLKKWDYDAATACASHADRRRAGLNAEDGRPAPEAGRELVYCGYPDRPVAAHKVEDLAMEAQTLDGAGYKRLVILAWDYEYNYDELLQTRLKAAGKDIKTEIISRQIPPDIYEYLKKARNEEEIEKLAKKIKFFEKPYLKVKKPEVKENVVSVSLDNYVLYDFPLGSGKKADESREELIHLVKDNFAILIDYWAIDWDYDGIVFKSQWQDFRGNGRKAKIVATKKEHTYDKEGKHTIAMRVVDIFGNDATAIIEIKI